MLSIINNFLLKRVENAVAAGTTDQESDSVDMAGCQSCCFVALFGAITATGTAALRIQGSNDDSNWSDYADSDFTVYDSEDNLLALIEIIKPIHRYVRLYIDRATANAVIDGVIAIIGVSLRNLPVTQGATVSHYGNLSLVSPAVGTP
jgi:hypothetical protein